LKKKYLKFLEKIEVFFKISSLKHRNLKIFLKI